MCNRCNGYYWGLVLVLGIIVGLGNYIIPSLKGTGLSPYVYVILGVVIFIIATPIHGVLKFLARYKRGTNFYSSNWIKLVLGLVSGFAVGLIAIGIIMLL